MKLTKSKLQQIIKEELGKLIEISDKELEQVQPGVGEVRLKQAYSKTIDAMQTASTLNDWVDAMYDGFIGTPTQENERRAEYNLKKLDKQWLKFILEEVARLLTKAPPGETGGFAAAWDNFERAILGSRPDLKTTLQSFENSMLPTSRDRRSWQR